MFAIGKTKLLRKQSVGFAVVPDPEVYLLSAFFCVRELSTNDHAVS